MKKSKIFFTLMFVLLITGCAGRIPFQSQNPLENSALVYIYVSSDVGLNERTSDPYYRFQINNKKAKERIRGDEYIALNLKPTQTKLSVVRGAVEIRSLELNLEPGEIYYLKVNSNLENDDFELIQMDGTRGLQEIEMTGLAGSTLVTEDEIITEYVENPKKNKSVKSLSKADEIQRLYEMKEKGIITQDEFETLKAKIISK